MTIEDNSRIRFGVAIRAAFKRGYTVADLRADAIAGLVIGVVALPLSMALAIAAGAPPEHGLYTAIVAGMVIALTGGSMHSVSGPTAAFVVLLVPVTTRYGLRGLLVASVLAGLIMLLMGGAGLGKLIRFIPHPVTTGFTAGIAVVIAILQLGDLLGLGRLEGERVWERLGDLFARIGEVSAVDLVIGLVTLAVLVVWPKITHRVPGPLVGLTLATLLGLVLTNAGNAPVTIESLFGGIPQAVPLPTLPWAGADLGWDEIVGLLPTAAAIALLGAIESLLCAVVSDGMTGGRHDSDAELIGLGIGNIIAPFFGGFAATGAIARTATAIRAGSRSPLAVVVHSLFLLVAMLALAPVLGRIPMAGMAALLLIVAWNMSDFGHFKRITRIAPRSDVVVMFSCFALTVLFDMVVAVITGVVLAAFLFMRRMVEISGAQLVGGPEGHTVGGLPPGVVFYDVAGPLFFGAAEKALGALSVVGEGVHTVIIDLEDVPAVDATGLVALESIVERINRSGAKVVITGVRPQPRRALERAGFRDEPGKLEITDDVDTTMNDLLGSS
ncbi:MAG TPA: SulP family inorganic anion transporter [Acidimicrobiia bacterium]